MSCDWPIGAQIDEGVVPSFVTMQPSGIVGAPPAPVLVLADPVLEDDAPPAPEELSLEELALAVDEPLDDPPVLEDPPLPPLLEHAPSSPGLQPIPQSAE